MFQKQVLKKNNMQFVPPAPIEEELNFIDNKSQSPQRFIIAAENNKKSSPSLPNETTTSTSATSKVLSILEFIPMKKKSTTPQNTICEPLTFISSEDCTNSNNMMKEKSVPAEVSPSRENNTNDAGSPNPRVPRSSSSSPLSSQPVPDNKEASLREEALRAALSQQQPQKPQQTPKNSFIRGISAFLDFVQQHPALFFAGASALAIIVHRLRLFGIIQLHNSMPWVRFQMGLKNQQQVQSEQHQQQGWMKLVFSGTAAFAAVAAQFLPHQLVLAFLGTSNKSNNNVAEDGVALGHANSNQHLAFEDGSPFREQVRAASASLSPGERRQLRHFYVSVLEPDHHHHHQQSTSSSVSVSVSQHRNQIEEDQIDLQQQHETVIMMNKKLAVIERFKRLPMEWRKQISRISEQHWRLYATSLGVVPEWDFDLMNQLKESVLFKPCPQGWKLSLFENENEEANIIIQGGIRFIEPRQGGAVLWHAENQFAIEAIRSEALNRMRKQPNRRKELLSIISELKQQQQNVVDTNEEDCSIRRIPHGNAQVDADDEDDDHLLILQSERVFHELQQVSAESPQRLHSELVKRRAVSTMNPNSTLNHHQQKNPQLSQDQKESFEVEEEEAFVENTSNNAMMMNLQPVLFDLTSPSRQQQESHLEESMTTRHVDDLLDRFMTPHGKHYTNKSSKEQQNPFEMFVGEQQQASSSGNERVDLFTSLLAQQQQQQQAGTERNDSSSYLIDMTPLMKSSHFADVQDNLGGGDNDGGDFAAPATPRNRVNPPSTSGQQQQHPTNLRQRTNSGRLIFASSGKFVMNPTPRNA